MQDTRDGRLQNISRKFISQNGIVDFDKKKYKGEFDLLV